MHHLLHGGLEQSYLVLHYFCSLVHLLQLCLHVHLCLNHARYFTVQFVDLMLVRHLTDIVMHKEDAYIDFNAVKGKE
jgi:hypothetical protein